MHTLLNTKYAFIRSEYLFKLILNPMLRGEKETSVLLSFCNSCKKFKICVSLIYIHMYHTVVLSAKFLQTKFSVK